MEPSSRPQDMAQALLESSAVKFRCENLLITSGRDPQSITGAGDRPCPSASVVDVVPSRDSEQRNHHQLGKPGGAARNCVLAFTLERDPSRDFAAKTQGRQRLPCTSICTKLQCCISGWTTLPSRDKTPSRLHDYKPKLGSVTLSFV
jgi:hypothetical protein